MLRLILVRHGQTDWNAQARYQGQADIPLNDVGRRQAAAVAQRLASEEIDILFASDLRRAWETGTAIATARGQTLLAEPRLREMDFGQWQGLTHAEIADRLRIPVGTVKSRSDRAHRRLAAALGHLAPDANRRPTPSVLSGEE